MYTKWLIDPLHSFVRFEVQYLLLTKLFGWCTKFDGVFCTDEQFKIHSIDFNVYTNSLQTGNEMRDRQLKSSKFLNCKQFSVISYSAETLQAANNRITAIGWLQIKDAKRKTVLNLDLKGFATDQYDNTKAGLVAVIRLNTTDFDMSFKNLCGYDRDLLSEEINIQLELQLLRFDN